jgi:hypothetical protein
MSPFSRRSNSSSRPWANSLYIGFAVLGAALATNAFGFGLSCFQNIGPATEGVAFSAIFASTSAVKGGSPGGGPVIDWDDGTASAGTMRLEGCFTPPLGGNTVCTYGVRGQHTYSGAWNGINIRVQITDIGGDHSSCTTNAFDVIATGPPPPGGDVLSNPRLLLTRATVGTPVTGVIATFSDSNPSAVVSDFTALIDWGDGTQSVGVVGGSGGALSVSAPGDHAYSRQRGGGVTVSVSVSLSAPGVTTSTATGTVRVHGGR